MYKGYLKSGDLASKHEGLATYSARVLNLLKVMTKLAPRWGSLTDQDWALYEEAHVMAWGVKPDPKLRTNEIWPEDVDDLP